MTRESSVLVHGACAPAQPHRCSFYLSADSVTSHAKTGPTLYPAKGLIQHGGRPDVAGSNDADRWLHVFNPAEEEYSSVIGPIIARRVNLVLELTLSANSPHSHLTALARVEPLVYTPAWRLVGGYRYNR